MRPGCVPTLRIATDDVYNGDRGHHKRPNPVLWSEFRPPDSPQWGGDWGQGSEATLGAGVEVGSERWAAAVPLDRVSGSCGQNAEWVFVNRYHSLHIIRSSLPALLIVLGPANWWPRRVLDELLE